MILPNSSDVDGYGYGFFYEAMYGKAKIPTEENKYTGANYGSYSDPQFDILASVLQSLRKTEARAEILQKLARLFQNNPPNIPIFYLADFYVVPR